MTRSSKKKEESYEGPLTQESAPATRLESGEILESADDHERHAGTEPREQLDIEEGLSDG